MLSTAYASMELSITTTLISIFCCRVYKKELLSASVSTNVINEILDMNWVMLLYRNVKVGYCSTQSP
jgi:hypothetical protein